MSSSDGIATKPKSMFREACTVRDGIDATPETVWSLLVNAADFPRWNSTVTDIKGTVALGQILKIRVPISKRTFTVKVTALDAPRSLIRRSLPDFVPVFTRYAADLKHEAENQPVGRS